MKYETYIKRFSTEREARDWKNMKNTCNRVPNYTYCLVPGPADDFAVVDLKTAIELGLGYEF